MLVVVSEKRAVQDKKSAKPSFDADFTQADTAYIPFTGEIDGFNIDFSHAVIAGDCIAGFGIHGVHSR